MNNLGHRLSKFLTSRNLHTVPNPILSPAVRLGWICRHCSLKIQTAQRLSSTRCRGVSSSRSLPGAASLLSRSNGAPKTAVRRCMSARSSDRQASIREDLPSQREGRRSQIAKRFSSVMDHLQSNIFIAGQRLNDLTGYSGIEALKRDIELQEQLVQSSRTELQAAREAYSRAISQRSGSQREVNELLQRKHAWTPNDLERFTALYRSDHENEQAETVAQEKLLAVERRAEEAATKLSSSILARYHEEQIWSDKIRRMSTWGTWGLMGVNVLLFLVFQIGVEPWRRKRLVKGFEDKVMEALERENSATAVETALKQNNQDVLGIIASPAENPVTKPAEPEYETALLIDKAKPSQNVIVAIEPGSELAMEAKASLSRPAKVKAAIQDLFSRRQVSLQRIELTAVAFEGAAAGMGLAAAIFWVFLRPR